MVNFTEWASKPLYGIFEPRRSRVSCGKLPEGLKLRFNPEFINALTILPFMTTLRADLAAFGFWQRVGTDRQEEKLTRFGMERAAPFARLSVKMLGVVTF